MAIRSPYPNPYARPLRRPAGAASPADLNAPGLVAPQLGLWQSFKGQSAAFYSLLMYLLFEYVRPQSIYTFLAVVPWSSLFLLLTFVTYVFKPERARVSSPGTTAVIVFTVVLLLSSLAAYSPQRSVSQWSVYANWVLVYFAMSLILNTSQRWLVAYFAFLMFSFKMALHASRTWAGRGFTFDVDGVVGAPGWFYNSGELGIQMCILLPMSLAYVVAYKQRWSPLMRWFLWLVPLCSVMAILGSSSRGAVLGGAAAMLVFLRHSKHKVRTVIVLTVLAGTAWWSMPPQFSHRFDTAGEDRTSTERLDRWKAGIDMMKHYPVLGIGYENWPIYYPPHYKPNAPSGSLCHNIFIQAGAELGFLGLAALLGLIAACLYMTWQARRLARLQNRPDLLMIGVGLDGALLGYVVSGFFVTVLYYPYLWIHLGFCASLYGILRAPAAVAATRGVAPMAKVASA